MKTISSSNYKFIIGKEVGEQGTPHLQGYVEFGSPKTFNTVKLILGQRSHLEKAKADRAANIEYCSKDDENAVSNFPRPLNEIVLEEYNGVTWYAWQRDILDLLSQVPHKRKVYWFIDQVGNSGKSYLARYLVLKHDVLLVQGKAQDVFHQVAKRLDPELQKNGLDPVLFPMVVMDIPRHQKDFVNYGLLEQLKNGLILSGKYEGGTYAFPVPHVVVLSNDAPDMSKFSEDRWEIRYLD
jgi:hypothetical protein